MVAATSPDVEFVVPKALADDELVIFLSCSAAYAICNYLLLTKGGKRTILT